jgi:hypothetical protein
METLYTWLEAHMQPCPVKELLGFDCPGCGVQRSLIFLLRGDLFQSVKMYPALLPMLSLLLFLLVHLVFKFRRGGIYLKNIFVFSVSVMLVSYILRLCYH